MNTIDIDGRLFSLEQLSIAFRYAAADTPDVALRAKVKAIADAIDRVGGNAAETVDAEASAA